MVATEQSIRIAAKLYEFRDGAKRLLGERYEARMADFRKPIEIVQAKKNCGVLEAATHICKNADCGGFEVIFIMAAALEMIEPSPHASRSGAVSSIPDDDNEMDICESCSGTGIEEGREYDGHKCPDCKGRGYVHVGDNEQ